MVRVPRRSPAGSGGAGATRSRWTGEIPPCDLLSGELPQAPPSPTSMQWAAAQNPRRQQSASVDGVGAMQRPTVKQEEEK